MILASPASGQSVQAGACVGAAWIAAERAEPYNGPDFTVETFTTAAGPVSVYVGCCSEVSDDKRRLFTRIDGQAVYRTSGDKGFSGYLVATRRRVDGEVFETQLHFFGDGLKGDSRDLAFFRTVHFGRSAFDHCDKKTEQ
jgi:hypothetical protein